MKIKRIITLLLSICMVIPQFGSLPAYAEEQYDYFVEAESSANYNFKTSAGSPIQADAQASEGKYLNLYTAYSAGKEWYAEYTLNIKSAGPYILYVASTPTTGGWASDFDVSVNGEERQSLASASIVKDVSTKGTKLYKTITINLKKGSNTIRFVADTTDRSDGNMCVYLDYFALQKTNFGLYTINSEAPYNAFQKSEEIKFTVAASGKATENVSAIWEVTDYKGRLVDSGKTGFAAGGNIAEISVAPKKLGAYQLLVSTGGESIVRPFIVVNDLDERTKASDSPFAMDALMYGTRLNLGHEEAIEQAELLELCGVKWVRDRLYFDNYVTKNGDKWTFSMPHTKATGDLCEERDISVLMTMNYLPRDMYNNDDYAALLSTNLTEVYNFWKQLAETYDGAVDVWEILNEVDNGGDGDDSDGPDVYAAMFKAAALGIMDSETANEVYISPNGMAANISSGSNYQTLLYENEIYNYTDMTNYHTHLSVTSPFKDYYQVRSYEDAEERVVAAKEYGLNNVANWNGESGLAINVKADDGEGAEEQLVVAKFVVTSMLEDIAAGTDKRFYFAGKDYGEGAKIWGLTSKEKVNPAAFAGYAALSALTDITGEGRYLCALKGLPEEVAAQAFDTGNDTAIGIYQKADKAVLKTVSIPLNVPGGTLYDMWGNVIPVSYSNGVYSFDILDEPVYLKVPGHADLSAISKENVRLPYMTLPETQKTVPDSERVVLLQKHSKEAKGNSRKHGYNLFESENTCTVVAYNFNDYPVSGKIVGKSKAGWDINPLSQEVTIEPMGKAELTFVISPDGFKGQEDRISFYADMDIGKSTSTVIWANAEPVISVTPVVENSRTYMGVNLSNTSSKEKVINELKVSVDKNTTTWDEAVTIEPKSSVQLNVPVEISRDAKSMRVKAEAVFADGGDFVYDQDVSYVFARKKIDFNDTPSFSLPKDGAVASEYWYGDEDLRADVWVAADEENFYISAIVGDNLHWNKSADTYNIWSEDSIQFAFGQGLPTKTTLTKEFGIGLNEKMGAVMYLYRDSFGLQNVGDFKDAEFNVVRNDAKKETTYNIAIPWTSIEPISLKDNYMSFSLLLNDNDGYGRAGLLEFGSGIAAAKDPSLFKMILFDK